MQNYIRLQRRLLNERPSAVLHQTSLEWKCVKLHGGIIVSVWAHTRSDLQACRTQHCTCRTDVFHILFEKQTAQRVGLASNIAY